MASTTRIHGGTSQGMDQSSSSSKKAVLGPWLCGVGFIGAILGKGGGAHPIVS